MITFPRPMPSALKVVGMSFILDRVEELNPTVGGTQYAVDMGPPLWHGTWQSPPLTEEEFGEVRAWFDILASANEFLGFDTLREYPVHYRKSHFTGLEVGGNPFDGTCVLSGVTDGVMVGLEFLPEGFVLKPGDYIAFDYLTRSRALHRVSEGGVADEFGMMTIEVRPTIRNGWEIGSPMTTIELYRPSARMVVLPKTYTETVDVNREGRVSFEAIQTL